MFLDYNNHSIRLTGRWHCENNTGASTVCTGSYIDIAFKGNYALLLFDISTNVSPFPHLWLELDGNGRIEAPLDRILRVEANGDGPHQLRIILKSAIESQNRWKSPVQAVLRFKGAEVEEPADLPLDERPIIEFIGDSITEGVLTDVDYCEQGNYNDRVYQDDACATYAWLTAEHLSMRPSMMGFGRIGVTIEANGGVPPVQESYPYVYECATINGDKAGAIVINIGTNDRNASPDNFKKNYTELLKVLRSMNPDADIYALSPFVGNFEESLPLIVSEYNNNSGDNIEFISTEGWLPPQPVHPLRDGHKLAAEMLSNEIRKRIKQS